jgi:hypothetical protein
LIFEVKSYTARLTNNQKRKIKASLTNAAAHSSIRWMLVVPLDPSPAEESWFDGLRQEFASIALEWRGRDWLDRQFAAHADLRRYVEGSDSDLLGCAGAHDPREIELELRHQLDAERDREEKEAADRGDGSQGQLDFREPLSASEAVFDRVILGGQKAKAAKVGRAQEECLRLGTPVQYAMNLVPLLDQMQERVHDGVQVAPLPAEEPRHCRERVLRGEVDALVGKVSYAEMSRSDSSTRSCCGRVPARGRATVEQLEQIRAHLTKWLGAS